MGNPEPACSYGAALVQREVTHTQVFCWLLALVASVASLSLASLLLLADHEQRATMFAAGGLALILWSVFHLTDRPHHR
jgi:hypothetical protein